MGVRILDGIYDGTEPAAVLIDSVTGTSFGPMFDDHDHAQAFLDWFATAAREDAALELGLAHCRGITSDDDPRSWSDHGLRELHKVWQKTRLKAAA